MCLFPGAPVAQLGTGYKDNESSCSHVAGLQRFSDCIAVHFSLGVRIIETVWGFFFGDTLGIIIPPLSIAC